MGICIFASQLGSVRAGVQRYVGAGKCMPGILCLSAQLHPHHRKYPSALLQRCTLVLNQKQSLCIATKAILRISGASMIFLIMGGGQSYCRSTTYNELLGLHE